MTSTGSSARLRPYSWLDTVPLPLRLALVGGSIAVLGGATVGLGLWTAQPRSHDLVAAGLVFGTALVWVGAWWRFGVPHARAVQAAGLHAIREHGDRRDQVIGSWTPHDLSAFDVLASDPHFSLPIWAREVRSVAGSSPAACPRLIEATREGQQVRTRVAVREPGRLRILTVLSSNGAHTVVDTEIAADEPDPPPTADPGWPAARRALIARDGVFDVAGFEAQAREISAAVDAGDDVAGAYVTPEGALDLAYWRVVGLPPGGEHVEWLEVEQDGVFDRIELRVGGRVLSLCRPAAQAEAPWELWRLRRAA